MRKIRESDTSFIDKWHDTCELLPDCENVWFIADGKICIGLYEPEQKIFCMADGMGVQLKDVRQWRYVTDKQIMVYPEEKEIIAIEVPELPCLVTGIFSDHCEDEYTGDEFSAVVIDEEYQFSDALCNTIPWDEVFAWYKLPEEPLAILDPHEKCCCNEPTTSVEPCESDAKIGEDGVLAVIEPTQVPMAVVEDEVSEEIPSVEEEPISDDAPIEGEEKLEIQPDTEGALPEPEESETTEASMAQEESEGDLVQSEIVKNKKDNNMSESKMREGKDFPELNNLNWFDKSGRNDGSDYYIASKDNSRFFHRKPDHWDYEKDDFDEISKEEFEKAKEESDKVRMSIKKDALNKLKSAHPELKFEPQDDINFAFYVYKNDVCIGKILLDTHCQFFPSKDCPSTLIKAFEIEGIEVQTSSRINRHWIECCSICGAEEDGYNDPETGEPLCSDCYADRMERMEESKKSSGKKLKEDKSMEEIEKEYNKAPYLNDDYSVPSDVDEDSSVKDWYTSEYPTDDMGEEINSSVTFYDVFDCLDHCHDVYKLIGVTDSVVRERIFTKLAEIMECDYDYIYDQWLKCSDDDNNEDNKGDEDDYEQRYKWWANDDKPFDVDNPDIDGDFPMEDMPESVKRLMKEYLESLGK